MSSLSWSDFLFNSGVVRSRSEATLAPGELRSSRGVRWKPNDDIQLHRDTGRSELLTYAAVGDEVAGPYGPSWRLAVLNFEGRSPLLLFSMFEPAGDTQWRHRYHLADPSSGALVDGGWISSRDATQQADLKRFELLHRGNEYFIMDGVGGITLSGQDNNGFRIPDQDIWRRPMAFDPTDACFIADAAGNEVTLAVERSTVDPDYRRNPFVRGIPTRFASIYRHFHLRVVDTESGDPAVLEGEAAVLFYFITEYNPVSDIESPPRFGGYVVLDPQGSLDTGTALTARGVTFSTKKKLRFNWGPDYATKPDYSGTIDIGYDEWVGLSGPARHPGATQYRFYRSIVAHKQAWIADDDVRFRARTLPKGKLIGTADIAEGEFIDGLAGTEDPPAAPNYPLIDTGAGLFDRNQPVKPFHVGAFHDDRLYSVDTTTGALRYSPAGMPEYAPDSNQIFLASSVDDEIYGMVPLRNSLLVLSREAIHTVSWDRDNNIPVIRLISTQDGCVSPEAWERVTLEDGEAAVWLSYTGLRMSSGGAPINPAKDWEPVGAGTRMRQAALVTNNFGARSVLINDVQNERLVLYVPPAAAGSNLGKQEWHFYYRLPHLKPSGFKVMGPADGDPGGLGVVCATRGVLGGAPRYFTGTPGAIYRHNEGESGEVMEIVTGWMDGSMYGAFPLVALNVGRVAIQHTPGEMEFVMLGQDLPIDADGTLAALTAGDNLTLRFIAADEERVEWQGPGLHGFSAQRSRFTVRSTGAQRFGPIMWELGVHGRSF